MIKLIDLNFYSHNNLTNPAEVLKLQKNAVGYAAYINNRIAIQLVKHMNYRGTMKINNIQYSFFKSRNRFWYIPFKTLRFLKSQKPDIILSQGLIFPLQVIATRLILGRKIKIIVQHHGEHPFKTAKQWLQKLADRYITAYLFTSAGNAEEWIDKKIISSKKKCFEVLEASTSFVKKDTITCKGIINMPGDHNYLWIGRLHPLKDPLTVVKAFQRFIVLNTHARLYMIFQTSELLPQIQSLLESNTQLKKSVQLVGKVSQQELEIWCNAAEFFISASHKEGSGYALIEAMHCGCIPVVTKIPSFKKITADGQYGFLFEPGNITDLYKKLLDTNKVNKELYAQSVYTYSITALSYKAVADQICTLVSVLMIK